MMARVRRSTTVAAGVAAGVAVVAALAGILASVMAPAWAYADGDHGQGKLVMVLDSSGSMKEPDASGATKIDAAKQALNTVVDELPAEAKVGLRVYGATVFEKSDPGACTDSQLVVPIGPADKPALKQAIAKYKPYGETPIAHSLQEAAKDVGADGERTILLVSDGEETCDADPCAVARAIHERGINLRVDVVGLHVGRAAEQQLRCIADAGGGTYYGADDAEELTASLDQTALRAFRPFTVTGQPVAGALQESGAVEVRPGQYTDELGGTQEETGTKYYTIDRAPGSSLHVGFTAYPPSQGGLKGYNDAASLALRSPDGTDCVTYTGLQMEAGDRQILTSGLSYTPELDDSHPDCVAADRLILEIRRGTRDSSVDPAPATGTIPFEFLVIEEPPLADDAGLPASVGEDAAPTQDASVDAGPTQGETAGGGGFAQAATLGPGTWTDSIQGGEVLFYRVRVDWGQTPRVSFRVRPDTPAAQAIGAYGVNAHVEAYAPTRARIQQGDLTTVTATSTTTMTSALLPVRYRNREGELYDSSAHRMMSLAGYYYFVITMDSTDAEFQLPMDISVAVDGEPAGAPRYEPATTVDGPGAVGERGGEGDGRAAAGAADPSNDDQPGPGFEASSLLTPVAVAGGIGVPLAGVVVLALLLLRRKRTR
jgi:Ca-activated chloride channel homolog